jgi:ribosomal protein S18 acetylase RimI-like enzyme
MNGGGLTIDIRDASESDATEILEIQKLAFHKQGILYNDFALPPLVQTVDELLEDCKTYLFLKATHEGKIVGSVRGRAEGETCFISRLNVHPDYQNRGIGKRLMHAIENKFSGARRYELFTGEKSGKNLALYGKLGYSEYRKKQQSANVMLICMEKRKEGI